jgi:hypothetical protein
VESATVLASTREETKSLLWKIALLEGENAKVCRVREVAEETTCGLFDIVDNAKRQWEVSNRRHWE